MPACLPLRSRGSESVTGRQMNAGGFIVYPCPQGIVELNTAWLDPEPINWYRQTFAGRADYNLLAHAWSVAMAYNDRLETELAPAHGISISETPEATEFLGLHPLVRSLIDESRGIIARIFGQGAKIDVELVVNPEEDETSVLAVIQTADGWEFNWDRLQDFFAAWWSDRAHLAQGALAFQVGSE